MKIKSRLPENISVGQTNSVEFRVSERMLDWFMGLTGDRSSLHADKVFARRYTGRMLGMGCCLLFLFRP